MIRKLVREDDILNEDFRKQVIKEITGPENVQRKLRELRKHEVYKDRTKKWVIEALLKEFKRETVEKMQDRASNISICRKIVDKLAQCYTGSVIRTVDGDEASERAIEGLADELKMNERMKKNDKYLQLHKNTAVQVVPQLCEYVESRPRYKIDLRVLAPYLYDALEHPLNPEQAACIVLTDFVEANQLQAEHTISDGGDGRDGGVVVDLARGDRKDQAIADDPGDKGAEHRLLIWWTDTYHFTTDAKGQYVGVGGITPADLLNPIKRLPFVTFAEDQDGSFWADGGDDVVDGSILTNVLITDMFAIANAQGWGQMVITGKAIPKNVEGGPHNAIILEHKTGDPEPKVVYESSNPPLDMWMQMIEQFVALLLSTNNLSPANVSGKLDAANFPSGISMLIEQSESTADIQDRQRLFQDREPKIWELVRLWLTAYLNSDSLTDEMREHAALASTDVRLKFLSTKPPVSEKEKLDAIKLRKELGLDTMVDLIMMDNPMLTREEAEEKLKNIMKEKLEQAAAHAAQIIEQQQAAQGTSAPQPTKPGPDGRPVDQDATPAALPI